jgi:hypothetical protein
MCVVWNGFFVPRGNRMTWKKKSFLIELMCFCACASVVAAGYSAWKVADDRRQSDLYSSAVADAGVCVPNADSYVCSCPTGHCTIVMGPGYE